MTRPLLLVAIMLVAPVASHADTTHGVSLALAGHCTEAMPELDAGMRDPAISDADKRAISTAGVRCSILLNRQLDAMSFLGWLQQKYPADPDILFLAVHMFSELSDRNARQLMEVAPESNLVIQLNAEAFERRGEIAKAIAEYRILVAKAPDRQGAHYRLAGLLLSLQTDDSAKEAKQEFEQELRLNPANASAEFYLGELSGQGNAPADAIAHYQRAIKLYPSFGEAYTGLGRTLLDSGKTQDAIEPLERAATLAPSNPAVHLLLATAYQRSGRKADAQREFALQKSTAAAMNNQVKTLRKTVSGVPAKP